MKILLFAGTKNGRELAHKLVGLDLEVVVSSLTEHGNALLPNHPRLDKRYGPMSAKQIEKLIKESLIDAVVDATHPYAAEISQNIIDACGQCAKTVYRLERRPGFSEKEGKHFDSMEGACRYLGSLEGNVLLTTGSNQVDVAVQWINKDRLTVRLLPVDVSVNKAHNCGLKDHQILALNPPFGKVENLEHIRDYKIQYLLTKDGGAIGGTFSKSEAVRASGIELIVIDRPQLQYEHMYYEEDALIAALTDRQ